MDRNLVLETRRAMFWAALVAQCSGETHVTASRIAASLLRAGSVRELCERLHIALPGVLDAANDPATLPFEECVRRVEAGVAEQGRELGSKEHQASVQPRPLEPAIEGVFRGVVERHGALSEAPAAFLREILRVDPVLAERLAPHGLTVGAIT
jgi:hypothetical protein